MNYSQEKLKEIVQKLYNRRFPLHAYELEFISDIRFESNSHFNFVYFETSVPIETYKRYHMIVTDIYFIEIEWYTSNVIDSDKGYTIDELLNRFKNHLSYCLKYLQLDRKSVVEDTIQ